MKRPKGNPGCKSKTYADVITAFDIETTRIEEIEQSIMYIWQFQFAEYTIVGRTWEEYTHFLTMLDKYLPHGLTLLIFVHNLSYEFQFLRGIYEFGKDEVFAIDSRKVVKCMMYDRFEYRCSYILTNMSLSVFLTKYKVEHQKLPEFEYTKKRYPWTELSDKELEYCVNDVLGLTEAITALMESDGDTLATLPLTSTGYVRRDVKRGTRDFRLWLRDKTPSYDLYTLLRWAFRGGDTHANRYYTNKVIYNVKSYDRQSSYPDVMCNCKFPMGEFFHEKTPTMKIFEDCIYTREKACVAVLALTNVRLRDKYYGSPYIPIHKCRNRTRFVNDNGRVLKAEYIEICVTDIDYRIIKEVYIWDDIDIYDLYHTRYDYLPGSLRQCVIDYFVKKTQLKGVEGQDIYYMKSKNLLNSIYGMCATDPVKVSIFFYDNAFHEDFEADKAVLLMESNRKAFILYQWGVWVTAWARYRLFEGVKLCGDCFVYSDTDSVKFVGDVDWTEFNKARIADSIKNGAFAVDRKGRTQYMGTFDHDGEYSEFKTMGAKKYAYIDNGELHITISGVNKDKGAKELLKFAKGDAHKALKEFFVEGTIFSDAGGFESVYNDLIDPLPYNIDGHKVLITANVCLRPSTYTLGLTAEYKRIIEDSKFSLDNLNIIW